MREEVPTRPGSYVDTDDDGLVTSHSVKELAGNTYRFTFRVTNDLEREITTQCFLTAKNSLFAGGDRVNRVTREHAVRLSNLEPGEEIEIVTLVKGESPVVEHISDYKDFSGEKTGGERSLIEVEE
jgi:hypothetical protein